MPEEIVKHCIPFPPKTKILILGGGYSGQRIAEAARELGAETICSRRKINTPGAGISFDSATKEIPDLLQIENITHLISCIPPEENGDDPVLRLLKEQLQKIPLQWAGYLSTTGVYGNCHGNWVCEQDSPKPQQDRSIRRLNCEKSWQNSGLPIQILRLPGIYGPGRSAIDSLKKGQSRMIYKAKQVFSRIHVDDIAGATIHLMQLATKGIQPRIINIADNLPTSNIEVVKFAASLIQHSKLPPIETFEDACLTMSPMALSFWEENRKVSNNLLCKELGYKLLHPTYKEGLKECMKLER